MASFPVANLHLLPGLVFVAIGVFICLLARSVRGGNVEILAGYDPARVTDKAGLAAWAGGNLLLLGYIQIAAGALALVYVTVGSGIYFLATLLIAIRAAYGSFRFYR